MDLAEMMVYDARLTVQEMDREGNYLASSFGLPGFRLDHDVGSPTRSAAALATTRRAASKACGCTVARSRDRSGRRLAAPR